MTREVDAIIRFSSTRHLQHEALPLAVCGHEGDAVANRLLRPAVGDRAARDLDRCRAACAGRRSPPSARCARRRRARRARRSRPGPTSRSTESNAPWSVRPAHLEREPGRRLARSACSDDILERVADHQLDQPRPVELGQRALADGVAVAQDGDAVGRARRSRSSGARRRSPRRPPRAGGGRARRATRPRRR